jgi:hypothetical protein
MTPEKTFVKVAAQVFAIISISKRMTVITKKLNLKF